MLLVKPLLRVIWKRIIAGLRLARTNLRSVLFGIAACKVRPLSFSLELFPIFGATVGNFARVA